MNRRGFHSNQDDIPDHASLELHQVEMTSANNPLSQSDRRKISKIPIPIKPPNKMVQRTTKRMESVIDIESMDDFKQ